MENLQLTKILNTDNKFIEIRNVFNYNIIKHTIDAIINNQYESVIIIAENDLYKREWEKYITYYKFGNVVCYSAHEVTKKKEYMILSCSLLVIDIINKLPLSFEETKCLFRGDLIERDKTLLFNCYNSTDSILVPSYYKPFNFKSDVPLGVYVKVLDFPESLKVPYSELSNTLLKIHDVFKDSNNLVTIDKKSIFDNDIELIFACANGSKIQGKYFRNNEICAALARKKGWTVDLSNKDNAYAEQLDLYWNPINIQENATSYTRCLRARNDLLSNNHEKREAILNYLNSNFKPNTQVIILNTSTKFTEDLGLNLTASNKYKSSYFHSNITSRFVVDENGEYITYKTGVKKGKPKKIGKDSIKKSIIDNLHEIDVLSLCNTLDDDFIKDNLKQVIISSGSYDLNNLNLSALFIKKGIDIRYFAFNDFHIDNVLVKSKEITKLIATSFNQNYRNIWLL